MTGAVTVSDFPVTFPFYLKIIPRIYSLVFHGRNTGRVHDFVLTFVTEKEIRMKSGERMETNMTNKDTRQPRVLVIDDDPLFRAKVRRAAEKRNIFLTVCSSLKEVSIMADTGMFDIAIVDYYLDDMKSYLRGTDVARALETTPVILISNSDHGVENYSSFPGSVRQFLNKRIGINAILSAALRTVNPAAELN
jgi:PleD family two-component response regulator